MYAEKIRINFSGEIDTKLIASLTSIFSQYKINILDINMFNITNSKAQLSIVCQCSSITDEIDPFWNDIYLFSEKRNLTYSKQYIK